MGALHHAKELLLSQARSSALDGQHATPREGGAADAGLRRASLSPHSTTLSRSLAPYGIITTHRSGGGHIWMVAGEVLYGCATGGIK